ncbi:hypothetical protein GCM10008933_08040 [Paenibacillus motobuensis]|uniref:Uncharacterized protein n=1 Tax=Paenibacillus motobuensis TaxID=295324 RepID=A0ABP3HSP6_9BACL
MVDRDFRSWYILWNNVEEDEEKYYALGAGLNKYDGEIQIEFSCWRNPKKQLFAH